MSIFGNILNKIFHHSTAQASPGSTTSQSPSQPSASAGAGDSTSRQPTTGSTAPPSSTASAGGQPTLKNVDVQAVLSQLATQKGGGGNWRTSVVDLLKLLDLDSSLAARKALAQELNVHAGADGSAEQNIALQKAVMSKIAENGGKVPESLRN
jgi:hypothetical protein